MSSFDVVIVGGGIVGTASAYYLARQGHKVLLLEQFGIPNDCTTSGDHARMFHYTYGKDLFFTELAVKSLSLWKDFQKEIREDLYVSTGMLDLGVKGSKYEEACYAALKELKLPVESLGPDEIRKTYRIFSTRFLRFAVYHPDGGMIWARKSVGAFATAATRRRAVIKSDVKIASVLRDSQGIKEIRDSRGRSYKGSVYLFTPGPWTRELLSGYRIPLKVTQQQVLYFRPPRNQGQYRPGHLPVFSCYKRGVSGIPVHIHGFMKLEAWRKGPSAKPGAQNQAIAPQFERTCRAFLKDYLPDLARFKDAEGKICYYNNTPDGDFVFDRLPKCSNAYVATGFSGQGFTFAPLIARLMTEFVSGKKPEINLNRFRIARFR